MKNISREIAVGVYREVVDNMKINACGKAWANVRDNVCVNVRDRMRNNVTQDIRRTMTTPK